MPPFPQLSNVHKKVPALLSHSVIKRLSVCLKCQVQCPVQDKDSVRVNYHSVLRAWHKTYKQCLLVLLVRFSFFFYKLINLFLPVEDRKSKTKVLADSVSGKEDPHPGS